MVIWCYSKFSYSCLPKFTVYFCGCSSGFDFVFSVLVKRLARKSISEMTYFVYCLLNGMQNPLCLCWLLDASTVALQSQAKVLKAEF